MSRAPAGRRGAEDFLTVVLRFMPPETRAEVREVWDQGRRLARKEGTQHNDLAIFLAVMRQAKKEWDLVEEALR
jgi:hypothetical protein